MPGNLHHSMSQMEAMLQFVSFKITDPATVATVTGPPSFSGDVTCATAGAGRYDITIKNFRNSLGIAHVFPALLAASGTTFTATGIFVTSAAGYAGNGDTLTFSVGASSGGSGSAFDWNCLVIAC